jgi:DNA topoisomerase VI subunit B
MVTNGLGIAPEVVARLCDLSSRTSSRSKYVSPTRGAQGQALSTILVMPRALNPEADVGVLIQSRDYLHCITVVVNKLTGEPRLVHKPKETPGAVKTGTTVIVQWPRSACTMLEGARPNFYHLLWATPSAIRICPSA